MPHSEPLEEHANQKLAKIIELLSHEEAEHVTPLHAELWLKANKLHPHHRAELHLKTPRFDLNAHDEGADMYIVVDNTIDTMVKLLKKEKEKRNDKSKKLETEKNQFASDKYKL